MFRFGLPSFKLLIAGAVAAAAFAYHKGLFPEAGKDGDVKRPAAAIRLQIPPKVVQPRGADKPPVKPAKGLTEKRRNGKPAQRASTARPAKDVAMPRPMLTGSVSKPAKPRPPEPLTIHGKIVRANVWTMTDAYTPTVITLYRTAGGTP